MSEAPVTQRWESIEQRFLPVSLPSGRRTEVASFSERVLRLPPLDLGSSSGSDTF